MIYYVMLRGVDRFQLEYNRYPGEFEEQVEPDIVKLKVSISFKLIIHIVYFLIICGLLKKN